MRPTLQSTIVRVALGSLCVVLAACSSSSHTSPPVNPSDHASLEEARIFFTRVRAASPDFCKTADIRRNFTIDPSSGLPPIGAESRCKAWNEQIDMFAFTSTAYRDQYVNVRTSKTCAEVKQAQAGSSQKSSFYGFYWVVRPRSATLVPTYDVARMLAALLPGTYRFVGCNPGPAPRFVSAAADLDSIAALLQSHGIKCGGLSLRPTDAITRSSFTIDAKTKLVAVIYGKCAANPAIQLVGISPLSAGPATTPLAKILHYFCKRDSTLQVVHGLTWMTLTPDVALSAKIAPVLTKPSAPVCQAA